MPKSNQFEQIEFTCIRSVDSEIRILSTKPDKPQTLKLTSDNTGIYLYFNLGPPFKIEDENGQVFLSNRTRFNIATIPDGDSCILFLDPESTYSYVSIPLKIEDIEPFIKGDPKFDYFRQAIEQENFQHLYVEDQPVNEMMHSMLNYIIKNADNTVYLNSSLKYGIQFIIAAIFNDFDIDTAKGKPVFHSEHEIDNVIKVTKYIDLNISEPLSIPTVASKMNLSHSALKKLISKVIGKNFRDYKMELRVDSSKVLLITTNEPVHLIAPMVGYPSPPSYYKAFQGLSNQSPEEFRTNNQYARKTVANLSVANSSTGCHFHVNKDTCLPAQYMFDLQKRKIGIFNICVQCPLDCGCG